MPLGVSVSERAISRLPKEAKELLQEIDDLHAGDNRSDVERLEEQAQQLFDQAQNMSSYDRLVVGAALGECQSILGRWSGHEKKMRSGIEHVQRQYDFVQDEDGFSNWDRGQSAAWLGNTYIRLGYITRSVADFDKGIDRLEEADRYAGLEEVRPGIRGVIGRDLGDGYLGRMLANERGKFDGKSIRVLLRSIKDFGDAGDHWYREQAAARSSFAMAAFLTVDAMRLGREGLVDRNKIGYGQEELLELGVEALDSAAGQCESGLQPGAALSHLRWARVCANVGFAGQMALLLTGDRERFEPVARWGFDKAVASYNDMKNAFRAGVVLEGRADLERALMLSERSATDLKARSDKAAADYSSAINAFNLSDAGEHSDERKKACNYAAKEVGVAAKYGKGGRLWLTRRIFIPYSCIIMRKDRVSAPPRPNAGKDFAGAVAALKSRLVPVVAEADIEDLEALVLEAQKRSLPPEERRGFVVDVRRMLEAGRLELYAVDDGGRLNLTIKTGGIYLADRKRTRSFADVPVRVRRREPSAFSKEVAPG